MDSAMKDAVEAIQNLMGILDTPIGRQKFPDEFSEATRDWANRVLYEHKKKQYPPIVSEAQCPFCSKTGLEWPSREMYHCPHCGADSPSYM